MTIVLAISVVSAIGGCFWRMGKIDISRWMVFRV